MHLPFTKHWKMLGEKTFPAHDEIQATFALDTAQADSRVFILLRNLSVTANTHTDDNCKNRKTQAT